MIKHWFDTGVTPANHPNGLHGEHQAWRGGTLQIAFYIEYAPPEGYKLRYLFDYPNEIAEGQVAIPVVGGGMTSKFAVFSKGHL